MITLQEKKYLKNNSVSQFLYSAAQPEAPLELNSFFIIKKDEALSYGQS